MMVTIRVLSGPGPVPIAVAYQETLDLRHGAAGYTVDEHGRLWVPGLTITDGIKPPYRIEVRGADPRAIQLSPEAIERLRAEATKYGERVGYERCRREILSP